MIKKVDYETIKQYEDVFGRLKMMNLLEDFIADANNKLCGVESLSIEVQRLTFHSLRSSSLVFGMAEFSELCEKMEEQALSEQSVSEEQVQTSRELLAMSVCLVKDYFED